MGNRLWSHCAGRDVDITFGRLNEKDRYSEVNEAERETLERRLQEQARKIGYLHAVLAKRTRLLQEASDAATHARQRIEALEAMIQAAQEDLQ